LDNGLAEFGVEPVVEVDLGGGRFDDAHRVHNRQWHTVGNATNLEVL
jgi:hypothetical protein